MIEEPQKLPIELLETFVSIVSHDGQASLAAKELGISQPTMSKRLTNLHERVPAAWLRLEGKKWLLTSEGQRIVPVVQDLVSRYQQAESFVALGGRARDRVCFACGQTAVHGIAKAAVEDFVKKFPNAQVQVSTPRGKSRIEGVIAGHYDLAIVSDSPDSFQNSASPNLQIDHLFEDRPVLIGNPPSSCSWSKAWDALPRRRKIKPSELSGLPLVLPEISAARRLEFDVWFKSANQGPPNVVVETGGWASVMQFVVSGLGVGLITSHALTVFKKLFKERAVSLIAAEARSLEETSFPHQSVHLIYRETQGSAFGGLSEPAKNFRQSILKACKAEQL